MSSLDPLLSPVSEQNPGGEDISYAPEFLELDSLIRGKAETQFSEAVKPDWKLAHRRCLKLLELSKHLQVTTVLCLTSLQTGGIVAAADALEFLSKLLSLYWDSLYPKLDPSDNNDPLERFNILTSLTCPVGTFGDSFRFVERLSEAALTNSPRFGRLSFLDLNPDKIPGSPTEAASQEAQIEAAFRDTPEEELESVAGGVRRAITAVREITAFLDQLHGAEKSPSFDVLLHRLAELEGALKPYLPVEAVPVTATEAVEDKAAPAQSPQGAIRNRNDVVAALDRICAFYAQTEPSSPVPLLLHRARRLVHSDFLKIMADLAPDSVSHIRAITGVTEG